MNSQDRHRQQQERGLRPRLQRCNAVKNIDYHVPGLRASLSSGAAAASEEPQNLRVTRALDLCPVTYAQQKSFRIDGSVDGEVEIICDILGLEGPEGFGISLLEWEKRKVRPSSELLLRSRLLQPESWTDEAPTLASNSTTTKTILTSAEEHVNQKDMEKKDLLLFDDLNNSEITSEVKPFKNPCATSRPGREGDGGIRGTRPPILLPPRPRTIFSPSMPTMVCSPSTLKPPPSMSLPVTDTVSSTWDLIKSFAPEANELEMPTEFEDEGGLVVDAVSEAELKELWLGNIPEDFTGISSFSTMNDDDSSSTTTETFVSPNGRLKRKIRVWMLGVHLGSGSYGTVYEGMSEEGFFFAVKEVSLLDQGSNAEQCIHQLEQEIALLSQFEHENIVQYYGTDKKDSKLYIFLELVTQGSLASLYQKYRLQESQVSAYTRQILNGLNYLHERNVVHRDIKCANILVHVNGSVKLADFGLAKEITKFDMLKSCKGSVYWMAPEVVNPKKTYGPAADIWSLGCTVLEMLTRQIPYPNVEWAQALYNIGRGEQPPIPEYLSRSARDFIKRCVKVNPNDRPTACQLLKHPFVKSSLKASSGSNLNSFNNNKR